MTEDLNLTRHVQGREPEEITLTTVMLGMWPFVLIEVAPASDGSGEPALLVKAGGGAEEQIGYLPFLMLTEMADSPLAQGIAEVREEYREAGDEVALRAVARVAEHLGVQLPEAS